MFGTITIPVWLFALILVFAGVTFASHFLFPSVRWFLRRRMERVVTRLNRRLAHPIQPFKLMARPDMIARLVHDPQVALAISEESARQGIPEPVMQERARRYAREIVPAFSASLYFGFAVRAARWLTRLVYVVRVTARRDDGAPENPAPEPTRVYVMNHRSNMDYILVTHLLAKESALSYAVGEWARIWPLSWLIRLSGAYFIRRQSHGLLYRRVLARYVQLATEGGVTQAIFPEGGLSLDGATAGARLGILSYIVAAHREGGRDVIFVPVSINYDRVIEDRVLTAARRSGTRRFRASLGASLHFLGRNLWRALLGRFQKFGTASVSFGTPLSLTEFLARGDAGPDPVESLAHELMDRIRANIMVLSVPLVAAVLAEHPRIAPADLERRAADLAARLDALGARLDLAGKDVPAMLARGLKILLVRRIVLRESGADGLIMVREGEEDLIRYYAASLTQRLSAPAQSAPARRGKAPRLSAGET